MIPFLNKSTSSPLNRTKFVNALQPKASSYIKSELFIASGLQSWPSIVKLKSKRVIEQMFTETRVDVNE